MEEAGEAAAVGRPLRPAADRAWRYAARLPFVAAAAAAAASAAINPAPLLAQLALTSFIAPAALLPAVGWCWLTVSNPVLKAPRVSALKTIKSFNCFQTLLSISTCAATPRRSRWPRPPPPPSCAPRPRQGLTLVHLSAQPEPFFSLPG